MIAPVIRTLVRKEIRMELGEKCLRGRLQDISRTPFRRKAKAFPWLHAGASVGARAARKGKASKINVSNGTTGHSRPKAVRP